MTQKRPSAAALGKRTVSIFGENNHIEISGNITILTKERRSSQNVMDQRQLREAFPTSTLPLARSEILKPAGFIIQHILSTNRCMRHYITWGGTITTVSFYFVWHKQKYSSSSGYIHYIYIYIATPVSADHDLCLTSSPCRCTARPGSTEHLGSTRSSRLESSP